jgi:hypothetical protein
LENSEEKQRKAIAEIQLLYEKISRVQYELTWFPFKVGQLGAIGQLGPPETARAMIESMRADINDLMDATEACALQMGQLLANVEQALDRQEEV